MLRRAFDAALFLGGSYEAVFDQFEVLVALVFADLRDPSGERHVWGPPGRFLWKHRHSHSPMVRLIRAATDQGEAWPPLASGFFGGSSERFLKVAKSYKQQLDESAPF
jgi:hypothetical protein